MCTTCPEAATATAHVIGYETSFPHSRASFCLSLVLCRPLLPLVRLLLLLLLLRVPAHSRHRALRHHGRDRRKIGDIVVAEREHSFALRSIVLASRGIATPCFSFSSSFSSSRTRRGWCGGLKDRGFKLDSSPRGADSLLLSKGRRPAAALAVASAAALRGAHGSPCCRAVAAGCEKVKGRRCRGPTTAAVLSTACWVITQFKNESAHQSVF